MGNNVNSLRKLWWRETIKKTTGNQKSDNMARHKIKNKTNEYKLDSFFYDMKK